MQTALTVNCEGCRSVLSTYPSCESVRIRQLASQTKDVLQALLGGNWTSIVATVLPGEVCLGLSRRSWCHSGSSGRSLSWSSRGSSWRVSRSGSASHAAVASTVAAGVWITATITDASGVAGRHSAGWIDDVISALLEGLLSLTADTAVAVSQSDGQSVNDTLRAAALVLAKFIANLVSSGPTNAVIRIVQTVDEG